MLVLYSSSGGHGKVGIEYAYVGAGHGKVGMVVAYVGAV